MIRKLNYEELLQARKNIDEVKTAKKLPISVILNNVRSLYNVGTIFRTCDSAFVNELILTGFTPFPPRKEIEKTALGATESVVWRYEENIIDAIKFQKSKGEKIVAVEITDTGKSCFSLETQDFPICFVLGNELTGIDTSVLNECDDAIEIPMFGVKHSLNVGVAAGIVIYEAVRIFID
jgi:tRNA G18 (ribose-2'-O)-methylase SpoU